MALTQEQAQRLRQMSPENRRGFHLNRIATSLESIEVALAALAGQRHDEPPEPAPPK